MSGLREALARYLSLRRSLGFALGEDERVLRRLVTFAEHEGAAYITIDLVLRWDKQPSKAQPSTKAAWVAMVRRFALWHHNTLDPRTELLSENLLAARYCRKPPYIYNDEEVERLVRAAGRLPSPKGLRGLTYSTFFGLLAVTGMRISEGLALDRGDVDLEEGLLTIRRAKFGKSRLVPVHESTCRALRHYAAERDRILARTTTPAFFLAEHGTRITTWSRNVSTTMRHSVHEFSDALLLATV